jgi:GAF domain-containing protein
VLEGRRVGHPDRYRFRRAWSTTSRADAASRVNAALRDAVGLIGVAEAVGEAFLEIMVASTVTVSLLETDMYWDLVTVGELGPGEMRFPDERYPMSYYPYAAQRLLAGEGYIQPDGALLIGPDHPHFENWAAVGSFMGVPVIAGAQPRGQILIGRGRSDPPFLTEDLEVASDLSTHFGAKLPALLHDYDSDYDSDSKQ